VLRSPWGRPKTEWCLDVLKSNEGKTGHGGFDFANGAKNPQTNQRYRKIRQAVLTKRSSCKIIARSIERLNEHEGRLLGPGNFFEGKVEEEGELGQREAQQARRKGELKEDRVNFPSKHPAADKKELTLI